MEYLRLTSDLQRVEWLRWLWTAFGFALFAVTGPLWFNDGVFTQVPWFAWGCDVPRTVDSILLLTGGVSLLVSSCLPAGSRTCRGSLALFAASLVGLILLDQHRTQPWAYQWLLIAIIWAGTRPAVALMLLRVLTLSIYVHSAFSKCDLSFCQGLGHDFLHLLLTQITGMAAVNRGDLGWWPLIFPLGELIVACGLTWSPTRQCALYLSIAMHVSLLHLLGPWGLQHSAAVLIWNGFFIAQNGILFGGWRGPPSSLLSPLFPETEGRRMTERVVIILVAFVVAWPLSEPLGGCDVWPAWGLYAQHGESLIIRVTPEAYLRLPPIWRTTARRVASEDTVVEEWQLRPQEVSLQLTRAPLYPQNRFALGVIQALVRNVHLSAHEFDVILYSPANRWTGERQSQRLTDLNAIEQAAARSRWNARPRQ